MAAEKQMNDVLTPDQQKAYAEFKLDKKMNKQHQTGTSPMPPVTPPGN
jgi:Spy/CpxP family protein refolding chaperone